MFSSVLETFYQGYSKLLRQFCTTTFQKKKGKKKMYTRIQSFCFLFPFSFILASPSIKHSSETNLLKDNKIILLLPDYGRTRGAKQKFFWFLAFFQYFRKLNLTFFKVIISRQKVLDVCPVNSNVYKFVPASCLAAD